MKKKNSLMQNILTRPIEFILTMSAILYLLCSLKRRKKNIEQVVCWRVSSVSHKADNRKPFNHKVRAKLAIFSLICFFIFFFCKDKEIYVVISSWWMHFYTHPKVHFSTKKKKIKNKIILISFTRADGGCVGGPLSRIDQVLCLN